MEKPQFVYTTYIRTTPEKLWQALTSGDFSQKYWFGSRIEVEQKAGGAFRILQSDGTEGKFSAGQVLVCEPPRKLTYTWAIKDTPEVAKKRDGLSRVTYEITPMDGQVRLRLIHENLLPEDVDMNPNTFKGINNGWPAVLSNLKSLLETGEVVVTNISCASEAAKK